MIGSLDFQVVKGSLVMPSGALQVAHLILHTKEMARDFRLAAHRRAFSRALLGTFRLVLRLHAQNQSKAHKMTLAAPLRKATPHKIIWTRRLRVFQSGLSAGHRSDHPAGNTPPPPCTMLPYFVSLGTSSYGSLASLRRLNKNFKCGPTHHSLSNKVALSQNGYGSIK